MADEKIKKVGRQILAKYNEIPPMPEVFEKIVNAIKIPSTSAQVLADIISENKEIETKTLALVNSPFYNYRQNITSINKVILLLGVMRTKNIALALSLKSLMLEKGTPELWEHSVKCAVASEMLAKEHQIINPDDAFVIGFLHDIGKLILNSANPSKYSKIKNIVQKGNHELIEVEDAQFGTNHQILGALISKRWQLPVILTNCIRYHHTPLQSPLPSVSGIAYVADRLTRPEMPTPLLESEIMNKLEFTINNPVTVRETIMAKAGLFWKVISEED
ncbi:HDOD domain-containing protein [bacterium]|nr:HDOD domain-containing protein [bacterium]